MGNKISVIIPHYPFSRGIDEMLKSCTDSLSGYDELIVVVNEGTGFARAVNTGLRLAKGDYLMVINNDIVLTEGLLSELCIPNTVTSPKRNGDEQSFWGSFFCIPRNVYEQIGGLDEQFEIGFYEDDDYLMRLKEADIQTQCIPSCNIETKGSQTMSQFNVKELMETNKAKFDKKWPK